MNYTMQMRKWVNRLLRVPMFLWSLFRYRVVGAFWDALWMERSDENNWARIRVACDRLIRRTPKDSVMHAVAIETIAEVNMREGKYAEAASQFDAVIKLNEAHGMKSRGGVPYLYECLGACLFMIQDYENASLAFAKAKTLGADAEHIDRKIQACLDRRLDDAAVVAMWN